MSISALSSNLVSDLSRHAQNPFQEIRQDFRQLASALQSGDLTDAQSAYSSIQQVLQANQGSSTAGSPNTLQSDFAAVGQALQAGDLSTAQSAFAQLKSDASGHSRGVQSSPPPPAQDQYAASPPPSQNTAQETLQDYAQLASAVQSGDLTDAQTAYTSLQQLLQSSQSPAVSSNIQTDFTALGQALQSGNAGQAQSAFSQLQTDFQTPAAPTPPVVTPPPPVATPAPPAQPSVQQQVRQDYAQLAGALSLGDLQTAQSAFTALQQVLQTQTPPSTSSSPSSSTSADPILNDFNALGQALSSGNLAQAKSAFSQLNNDVRSAQHGGTSQTQGFTQGFRGRVGGHHHHHHGGGGYSNQSSSTTSSSDSSSSGSGSGVSLFA
jgi:hypothetical protein